MRREHQNHFKEVTILVISKVCISAVDYFSSGKGTGTVHELGNCNLDYRCCCCKLEQSPPAHVAIGTGIIYHKDPHLSHQVKITAV